MVILLQGSDLASVIILSGMRSGVAFWLQLPGGTSLLGLAPLLFIFAIFYFLLIMPQQRKQKKWQAMLGELKNGDKIVTSGGLRGTIISLKDDAVTLRVPPDNLKLEVSRASVVSVTTAEEGK
jgi:preprotein translocase subunit YajC